MIKLNMKYYGTTKEEVPNTISFEMRIEKTSHRTVLKVGIHQVYKKGI